MPYIIYHVHIRVDVGSRVLHFHLAYTMSYNILDIYSHMGGSGIKYLVMVN